MTDQTTSSGSPIETAIFEILSYIIKEGSEIKSGNPFDKLAKAYPSVENLRAFSKDIADRLSLGMEYSVFIDTRWTRTLKFSRDSKTNQYTVYISGASIPENEDLLKDLMMYAQTRMKRCYKAVPA